jgi:hypothetical protein
MEHKKNWTHFIALIVIEGIVLITNFILKFYEHLSEATYSELTNKILIGSFWIDLLVLILPFLMFLIRIITKKSAQR